MAPTSRISRVIVIDSAEQSFRSERIDVTDGAALRRLVGGWIEAAYRWPTTGDVLYVDEEGLRKPYEHFFRLSLRNDPQPIAGNGVVVGDERLDADGNWLGCKDVSVTIRRLGPLVTFLNRAQADSWAKGNASEPSSAITTVGQDGRPRTEVLSRIGEVFGRMPRPEAK